MKWIRPIERQSWGVFDESHSSTTVRLIDVDARFSKILILLSTERALISAKVYKYFLAAAFIYQKGSIFILVPLLINLLQCRASGYFIPFKPTLFSSLLYCENSLTYTQYGIFSRESVVFYLYPVNKSACVFKSLFISTARYLPYKRFCPW